MEGSNVTFVIILRGLAHVAAGRGEGVVSLTAVLLSVRQDLGKHKEHFPPK